MGDSKTTKILELLKNAVCTTAELFDILPGYKETYIMMHKKMIGHMDVPKFNYKVWKKENEQRFYALLVYLKQEGFITKKKVNKKSLWQITKEGLQKLKLIKDTHAQQLPKMIYEKNIDDGLNLVIFDIPEKYKDKRVWLRNQLKFLEFKLLQKSVWIGKYKIPEDFIKNLKRLNILCYIHILKVYKKGSLINLNL